MIFLISFFWFITASFAFLLAILTPHWATIKTKTSNETVHRGIFYSCDLLNRNETYENTRCLSFFQQKTSIDPQKWTYEYAIATASIAIGCAGLSFIIIWILAIYLHVIQRSKSNLSCLLSMSLPILITGCASLVVWILIIVETARLSQQYDRQSFQWPMWLSVGSTGAYFISFFLILISFCRTVRHRRMIRSHYYQQGEHF